MQTDNRGITLVVVFSIGRIFDQLFYSNFSINLSKKWNDEIGTSFLLLPVFEKNPLKITRVLLSVYQKCKSMKSYEYDIINRIQ